MGYISVREAAKKWQVSERRVHQYCKEDRIPGLQRFGRSWAIPEKAEKPSDPRREVVKLEAVPTVWDSVRVGAVITAAGSFDEDRGISPFMNIGNTSLIRRIVLIFQTARISPIVVITGYKALELEHHLSDYGVIFIQNEDYEGSDKLASVKLGLDFLQDKCDKIFFASLKIPMFMPETLKKMICEDNAIIVPQFEERNGHPLLLDSKIVPDILNYQGNEGMQGAMNTFGWQRTFLEVQDEGVLLSAENIDRLEDTLELHDEKLLRPFVRLSIEKAGAFFDARAELLLFLIQEFHSVQGACKQMAISRGKAWEMITKMEKELGFTLVERQQGGSRERKTKLTAEGMLFLEFFKEYEECVKLFAIQKFQEKFSELQRKIEEI